MRDIAENWSDKDTAMFTAHCSCGHPRDQHVLSLENVDPEKDFDDPCLELTIYYTGIWHDPYEDVLQSWQQWAKNTPGRLWRRFKVATCLLFRGYTANEHYAFVFDSEEQIRDYILALQGAIKKISPPKDLVATLLDARETVLFERMRTMTVGIGAVEENEAERTMILRKRWLVELLDRIDLQLQALGAAPPQDH